MDKQELISRIQGILDMQKVVMLENNGRPDCKNCSLAETMQKLLDEHFNLEEAQNDSHKSTQMVQ